MVKEKFVSTVAVAFVTLLQFVAIKEVMDSKSQSTALVGQDRVT
jgi:hypothetical protein